uniref:GST N-terminal domain-containing protein n=1 Tax=Biomphalaria glabrata TaxID=6526 RepID=A0A182YTV0_BIOGL
MICQMPTLRLYYDLLSQPSRAVYIFLRLNNVSFEPKPVALRKDEHQTDEFKKINPFSLVPVVDDDGFLLTESMAILKYVIGKYELGDHWFPQHNLKKQARVEEYLHWHQFNTRGMCASLFQQLVKIQSKKYFAILSL